LPPVPFYEEVITIKRGLGLIFALTFEKAKVLCVFSDKKKRTVKKIFATGSISGWLYLLE